LAALALLSDTNSVTPDFSSRLTKPSDNEGSAERFPNVNDKTRLLTAEGYLAKVGKTIEDEDCISKHSSLDDGPPAVSMELARQWMEVSTVGNGTHVKVCHSE